MQGCHRRIYTESIQFGLKLFQICHCHIRLGTSRYAAEQCIHGAIDIQQCGNEFDNNVIASVTEGRQYKEDTANQYEITQVIEDNGFVKLKPCTYFESFCLSGNRFDICKYVAVFSVVDFKFLETGQDIIQSVKEMGFFQPGFFYFFLSFHIVEHKYYTAGRQKNQNEQKTNLRQPGDV